MPNWCENELTISGRSGVLACLVAIKEEPDEGNDGQPRYIDFQRIVPMPGGLAPDAEEMDEQSILAETGCRDWDEWRDGTPENAYNDGHWGTCQNACYFGPPINATDRRADLAFETAWSPPSPVIIALSKQFPTLNFTLRYWECGCGFSGILRVRNGCILRNDRFDYGGSRGG